MTADELCRYLAHAVDAQRDKLATVRRQVDAIRALPDDDHQRVLRAIEKRLSSPQLATEVAALLGELARTYAPCTSAASLPARLEHHDPALALEAQIAANPDDRASYLVYGDWLSSRDDPRGALIAIGAALAQNPNREIWEAHRAHVAEHAQAILGPLADCDDVVRDVGWFMGFIKSCTIGDRPSERARPSLSDLLGSMLDDPGPGRFLQHLALGVPEGRTLRYDPLWEVLARRPRPSLRRLYVGDFRWDECNHNSTNLGDLSTVWPVVPNLRELTLSGGRMTIGPIHLPHLEKLVASAFGLDEESLAAIATGDWPMLGELHLGIGTAQDGAATDVRVLEPILSGERFPRLHTLGITNCELTDELCERLPTARILPQLRSLDLYAGTMTNAGAAILLAHVDKLRHIRIDITDNYLLSNYTRQWMGFEFGDPPSE